MKRGIKKKISNALYVLACPDCGHWMASASEWIILPESSVCEMCRKEKKKSA